MATKLLNSGQNISFKLLINNYFKSHKILSSFSTLNATKNESNKEIIKIPKRIERGPTDILRALAETVQRDLSGPDYRYLDDPFTTPLSNYQKRVYSLSKESGRRAAKYVFDEFPELFFRDDAEPKIEALTYKDVYDESTEVDETDLRKCISRKEVNHSIVCYKNLVRDSKPMSSQSLQNLLELVCFYNCEEPPDIEYITEKIFMRQSENPRLLWKDNGFAEQLFSSIEEKTSESYCTLIQGMAKYSQSQKAHQYYLEMIEKGFKLNVETYNSLIKIAPKIRESSDSRWLYIEDILNSMKSNGIKPNVRTLNDILEVINRFGTHRFAQNLAKKTLVEMINKLGVRPSLATYHHTLNIFYKERGPSNSSLYEIIDRIEDQSFQIQDPNDIHFFVNAMNICNFRLKDISLAHRIHRILESNNNYKLLGSVLIESNYFQQYFRLLSSAEDIKVFMEIYKKYVPNVYIPEPIVMSDIFKLIDLYEAYNYLPKICFDYNNFEYSTNIKLTEELFYLLSKPKGDNDLLNKCCSIVTECLKTIDHKMENQIKNGHLIINQFTGELLGFAIEVYLNNNDIESAVNIIKKFSDESNKIIGNPSPQTFIRLCLKAIDEKMYSFAKHCTKLSIEMSIPEVGLHVLQHIRESDLDQNIKKIFEENSKDLELLSSQVMSNPSNEPYFDEQNHDSKDS